VPVAADGHRSALVALALVVLTGLALVVAGTAPRSTGASPDARRSATVGRDLVCSEGLPGAGASVGRAGHSARDAAGLTVAGRPVAPRPVPLDAPVHVQAAPDAAADSWAVRAASGRAWLAAGACPVPAADWWLVGVGGSTSHDSVVEVDNPRAGDALVDLQVLGPRGPVQAPGLQDLRIASGGRMTFDLAKYAPATGDLAVHVTASRGLVAVSGPERWSPGVLGRKVRDWVTPQGAASRRTTLVGIPAGPDHAAVLVANPSGREAVVSLQFVGEKGSFAPTKHASLSVPPGTVLPVRLDDELGAKPVAVRVRSQVPVAATVRVVRGADEAYAGAGSGLGAAAVSGIPTGAPAELVLVAGLHAVRPTVVGYDAAGRQVGTRRVDVPARGAARVPLWRTARSLVVRGGGPAAGAVLIGGRTLVAVLPIAPTGGEARVPAVRVGAP
jgi:hypothetical protein